ncbi:hypothetical protein [Iningainema tapete]|uniref:Uncharacterized protein n=1 Tax=Iningainema tapete BLCC-T55 TaxID=2748662 RepID=A0A8J7C608_9CYAN|nr:hypothetical protein [Iningainema tapete]MBD2771421.1 hypothetical protein [Iningainema tapete BLCC-T55]
MIISDLNHLEVVEASVVGGIDNYSAHQNLSFTEKVNVSKFVKSIAIVVGNTAFAEADADAVGFGTVAQGLTRTSTTGYSSSASSTSLSASNGSYFYWH